MTKPATRFDDPSKCSAHDTGPATGASPDVEINRKGALRMEDQGTYTCDGANEWNVIEGAATVFANGLELASLGHKTMHPHGDGVMVAGSTDVLIGGPTANFIEQVRADGLEMIDKVLEALERWNASDRALFRKWFGDDSEAARSEMREKYQRMRKLLETVPIIAIDDSVYGRINKENSVMKLGRAFWKADRKGRDSKAGTMVHEAAHPRAGADASDRGGSTLETDPFVYGEKDAKALAKKNPAGARANAENLEYFAEDQP